MTWPYDGRKNSDSLDTGACEILRPVRGIGRLG